MRLKEINRSSWRFNNQEIKTGLKEETKYSAPISIEEKVAANDDNKQRGAPDSAKGWSSKEEIQNKKVEEMTFTNEEGGARRPRVYKMINLLLMKRNKYTPTQR
jgi:ABC-type phosphonate transport system ATPase subunit